MQQPKKIKFKYLQEKSYLAYITNSVGSKTFRNYYVQKGGKTFDVLKGGELSCAFFVSTVLIAFGLTKKIHFTVARTAEDLLKLGGKKVPVSKIKLGDVLIWNAIHNHGGSHNHIGFYLGKGRAVSNSEKKGMVVEHDLDFQGTRGIELAIRPTWRNNA